jgi:type II secretory pathway pseudopilin PulG
MNRPVSSAAFTLLEALLVVVLLASLTAATSMTLGHANRRERFAAAVDQFADILSACRAAAASSGKRLRMRFGDAGQPTVEYEPDPLARPGEFEPYWDASIDTERLSRDLRCVRCELAGVSAQGAAWSDDPPGEDLAPLVFAPDGSSSSARIELADGEDETLFAVIDLHWIDGPGHVRIMTDEEYADYLAESPE